jgi:hypothetical protein
MLACIHRDREAVVLTHRAVLFTHQIVCLECDQTQLYGEVIQVLERRKLCWMRPMVLVDGALTDTSNSPPGTAYEGIYPITDGPDLLWPLDQFRLALDTDVMPLMVAMQTLKADEIEHHQMGLRRLRDFIEHLWQKQAASSLQGGR